MRHLTTGRSLRLRRKTALIVGVTMLAALTTGIAYASASAASGPSTLYLCFQKNVGNLRLLDAPGQCRPSEQELNVDLTGAQGPVGPVGPQGATGPQGAKGDTGADRSQGRHRRDRSQGRHRRDRSQGRHRRDRSQGRHGRKR